MITSKLKQIAIVFLFFGSIALAENCLNNCSDSGRCDTDTGICYCRTLHTEADCSDYWVENKTWSAAFLGYSIVVIITQLIIVVISAYQIYIIFCLNFDQWTKWSFISYTMILYIIAGAIRILEFAVDPHTVRNIFPLGLEEFLFNFPILLWCACGFMLLLYWVELQQLSGIQELRNVSRLRPVLITAAILTAAVIFPIGVVNWILGENFYAGLVYSVFLAIEFIVCIIISLVYGIKLMLTMKKLYKSTKIGKFKAFLSRITRYLFFFDASILSVVIALGLYVALDAQNQKWIYYALHFVLRLGEFGVCLSTVIFMAKKRPNKDESKTSHTTEGKYNNSIHLKDSSKEEEPVEMSVSKDVTVSADQSSAEA